MTRGILAALCAALAVLTCIPAVAEAVEVSATACVLMDADTGQVLYEKNGDKRMLIASTTKLMTALVALELGEPSQVITVTAAHMAEGSSMYLRPGEKLTLEELLYGLLLCSGNDAALALTECAGGTAPFVERMNEKAAALGMRNSHFANPNGLDDEAHYSTAYDMAILTATALQNPDFREICGQATAKVTFGNPPYDRWLKNSNKLLTQCEGVIGVKTGFTDEAGRCLVSACQREDMTLICVTLNDPNDWQTHTQLYDTLFPRLHKQTVALPETISIPVVGGTADTVSLQATDSITYGTLQEAVDLPLTVHTKPFLFAPVPANQYGGFLVAERDGQSLFRLPLTTQTAVPEQPATPEEQPQKSI